MRWLVWALALIVGVTAGCTLLEAYPAPVPEDCTRVGDEDADGFADCDDRRDCASADICNEQRHCSDGIDNDRDGLADCEDTSCDGQCPEHDRVHCANARDDDGDGRVDLADASCWPFGQVEISRCPSVRGADVTLATLADFDSVEPGIVALPDPTDATHTVLGASAPSVVASMRAGPFEGTWNGTHLDARIHLAASGSAVVRLGPIVLTLAPTLLQLSAEDANGVDTLASAAADGWWTLSIDLLRQATGGPRIEATATPPSGRMLDVVIAPTHPWPSTGEASVTFEAVTGPSGSVLFDAMHLARPNGVACSELVAALDGVVEAVTGFEEGACATGFAPDGTLAVWVRDPESGVFFATGPPSIPTGLLAPAVALNGAQLVGVAPRADGSLTLLAGSDCGTWTALGDPFAVDPTTLPAPDATGPAPGIPGYGLAYAVVRRADGQVHHEIAIAAHQLDRRGIAFATSTSGAPGTFALGDFRALDTILDVETELWRSQVSVSTLGDDHVYLAGRREWTAPGVEDEVVHLYVDAADGSLASGDGFIEIARARIGPSGVDGALDDDDGIAAALLVETTPPPSAFRALLLVRPSTPGTVTDIATLTISPGSTCLNPMPEICNGIDDDCDGIVDDGSLCRGTVSGDFIGGSCGYVRVGDVTHPVDAARFGCVESYEPSDAGTPPTTCDPAYPCHFESAPSGCDPGSDCSFVTCAERGC